MTDPEIDEKEQIKRQSDANKIDVRNEIQEEYRNHPVPWFQWVFERLDLPMDARILELGSGPGTIWQENRGRIPRGWRMILSDRSQGMVRAARENLDLNRMRDFLCTDGQTLPFPNETFDAVLAVGVFDLVPNVSSVVDEVARVLRQSGQLITSAGGMRHLKEMETLIQPFLPKEKAQLLGGVEGRFGLENGESYLSQTFEQVTRNDYHDRMVFRSIQPILDYILSEDVIMESLTLQQLSRFLRSLKEHLEQQGQITVTVQKGLFTARKHASG